MLPLFPPDYPYRPDAPLLSLGPAFSEEIARSVVRAIWHKDREQPHETDVRTAAGLTMLEAFHPKDQLETMLSAQGVAAHCAIMDNFRCAADPNTPPLVAIKYRANAVALNRMFCTNLRELALVQSRPVFPRPGQPPAPTMGPDNGAQGPKAALAAKPRARARATPAKSSGPSEQTTQPAPSTACPSPVGPSPEALMPLADMPEIPEDIEIRPDGTPGNLMAYAPKFPVVTVIPREALIMTALATRPKPWRMVNVPKDQAPIGSGQVAAEASPPAISLPQPERSVPRGPVDLRERIFTGDALARFASARLDPDAPVEPRCFEHEGSLVELELISTGGDPAAEAERAAMMAAHPEVKPIVTFHHGTRMPPGQKLSNGRDEPPADN
jgi:hypothetical protein